MISYISWFHLLLRIHSSQSFFYLHMIFTLKQQNVNENRFRLHGFLSFVSGLETDWFSPEVANEFLWITTTRWASLFWNKFHFLVFKNTCQVGCAPEGSHQDCVMVPVLVNGIEIPIKPNKRMLIGHAHHRRNWICFFFFKGGRFWCVWSVKLLSRIMSTLAKKERAERCDVLKTTDETFS